MYSHKRQGQRVRTGNPGLNFHTIFVEDHEVVHQFRSHHNWVTTAVVMLFPIFCWTPLRSKLCRYSPAPVDLVTTQPSMGKLTSGCSNENKKWRPKVFQLLKNTHMYQYGIIWSVNKKNLKCIKSHGINIGSYVHQSIVAGYFGLQLRKVIKWSQKWSLGTVANMLWDQVIATLILSWEFWIPNLGLICYQGGLTV